MRKGDIVNWIKSSRIHLISWVIFMTYESVILGLYTGHFGKIRNYVCYYALNIALFYVHSHFILAYTLKQKKHIYWRIPLCIGAEIFTYIVFAFIFDTLLLKYTDLITNFKAHLDRQFFFSSIYRGFYFILFSTGYYFLITYLNEKRKSDELEMMQLKSIILEQKINKELADSRNNYLRAQINPHFLFNTLDFIYHNARKTSPLAADAILALADIMRYAIDTKYNNDECLLGDEIEQVESLIQLYRLKDNMYIDLQYTEDIKQVNIIPLVLITLTENMFKHGDLSDDNHPASIKLFVRHNILHIRTDNLIKNIPYSNSTNSGLNNITKRLKYSYRNKIDFKYYIDDQSHFKVSLSITL